MKGHKPIPEGIGSIHANQWIDPTEGPMPPEGHGSIHGICWIDPTEAEARQ